MEAIKLFEKRPKAALNWDYDGEAEVLYLSFGEPRAAAGVDIGEGVILRYEEKGEVVGLTILGLGSKLLNFLEEEGKRGLVAVLITLLVAVGGLVISGAAAGRS